MFGHQSERKTRVALTGARIASVAAHAALLLVLAPRLSHRAIIVSDRLPGTATGSTLLTYYAPGSLKPVAAKSQVKTPRKPEPQLAVEPKRVEIAPAAIDKSADSKAGTGTADESGLGQGDITLALQSYFPYPKPDLSSLPHGTRGDVILNAVIGADGKITALTLLKGLGSPVDEAVIATVETWKYTPAMKKGVAIASEQELHFHYERG